MSTATDIAKAALRGAISLAGKAVVASAVTALPLLGLPVINFCFNWIVNWVLGKIEPYLELWLVDTIIDIEVQAEKRAYERARDELREVLKKQIRDPKEVANASKEFDDRLAKLIRFKP